MHSSQSLRSTYHISCAHLRSHEEEQIVFGAARNIFSLEFDRIWIGCQFHCIADKEMCTVWLCGQATI